MADKFKMNLTSNLHLHNITIFFNLVKISSVELLPLKTFTLLRTITLYYTSLQYTS